MPSSEWKSRFTSNAIIILLVLTILFITFLAYLPSLDNDFLYWDDQFYVTSNHAISHPTRESLIGIANQITSLNYHPVTMLSFWINAKISGVTSAKPFILTNVFLHLLNTVLVFILVYQISSSKWIIAISTSLIFALHPMHVESVVWVSERKDLLYGFFFLCSILFYYKYVLHGGLRFYILGFILFIFSCLSKATAVSLVPCLFLVDLILRRDLMSYRFYVDKIPFLLFALMIGLIALNVQSGGDFYGLLDRGEVSNASSSFMDMQSRVINGCSAHFYYLSKFFYPNNHSAFHPYSMTSQYKNLEVSIVAFLSIALITWTFIVRRWDLLFGLGFYSLTIFLLLQFIPVGSAIVAERYTYLPYIGLAFLIGIGMQHIANRISKCLAILCISTISILFVRSTRLQSSMWQNHTTLFSQAADEYPNDAFIRKALASGYWADGKIDSALYHTKFAIDELGSETSQTYELLANCYSEKGNYKKANLLFDKAVSLDPDNVSARYHRGINSLNIDPQKAIEDFEFCEQSENEYFIPLIFGPRGRAYGLLDKYDLAIRELTKAIGLYPDDPNFYLDRAVTYDKIGKVKEASSDYRMVLTLNPNNEYASERIAIIILQND